MGNSIQDFLMKLPIPFIYSATAFIATEAAALLSVLPAAINGYSTVGIITAVAFIVGASNWIHNEIKAFFYPTPVSPPQIAPTATANAPLGIGVQIPTFSDMGHDIPYQLNAPLGNIESVAGKQYVVGVVYSGVVLPSGDHVPDGAVYLGGAGFGFNGSYFY